MKHYTINILVYFVFSSTKASSSNWCLHLHYRHHRLTPKFILLYLAQPGLSLYSPTCSIIKSLLQLRSGCLDTLERRTGFNDFPSMWSGMSAPIRSRNVGAKSIFKAISYKNKQEVNNPFRTEFTIVIFIHYKPRIAVSISIWSG